MFVYKLSGCGFDFNYSHLNFRFCACFKQGVSWHSGNYIVRIHSETCTWHDKNIQSVVHIMEEPPFSSLFGIFLLIYVFGKEPQFSSVFFCLCLSCLESFEVFLLFMTILQCKFGWKIFSFFPPFKSTFIWWILYYLKFKLPFSLIQYNNNNVKIILAWQSWPFLI